MSDKKEERKEFKARLPIKEMERLEQIKEQTGRPINDLIVDAVVLFLETRWGQRTPPQPGDKSPYDMGTSATPGDKYLGTGATPGDKSQDEQVPVPSYLLSPEVQAAALQKAQQLINARRRSLPIEEEVSVDAPRRASEAIAASLQSGLLQRLVCAYGENCIGVAAHPVNGKTYCAQHAAEIEKAKRPTYQEPPASLVTLPACDACQSRRFVVAEQDGRLVAESCSACRIDCNACQKGLVLWTDSQGYEKWIPCGCKAASIARQLAALEAAEFPGAFASILFGKLPPSEMSDSQKEAHLLSWEWAKKFSIKEKNGFFFHGSPGCLAGDSIIEINRAGKSFKLPIRDLVHRFNGGVTIQSYNGSRRYWNPSIPTTVRARMEDGTIGLVELGAALESGIKATFTVTTESGRSVRATAEHPFLTPSGWRKLEELVVGQSVYVDGGQKSPAQKRRKHYYHYTRGLRHHPNAVKQQRGDYEVATHRLVVEAEMNRLSLDSFVSQLKTTANDSFHFLASDQIVHHIDGNPRNNAHENLSVLTQAEHAREHGREGTWRHVAHWSVPERIISIEFHGQEPTYDLSLASEPHNFLANGIVVHNTGKTLSLCRAMALLLQRELSSSVRYLHFPSWLDLKKQSFGTEEPMECASELVKPEVLLVDEILLQGKSGAVRSFTEWERTQFDLMVHNRWLAGKPTLYATNYTPAQVEAEVSESTWSRIRSAARFFEVSGKDMRQKSNVLPFAPRGAK